MRYLIRSGAGSQTVAGRAVAGLHGPYRPTRKLQSFVNPDIDPAASRALPDIPVADPGCRLAHRRAGVERLEDPAVIAHHGRVVSTYVAVLLPGSKCASRSGTKGLRWREVRERGIS